MKWKKFGAFLCVLGLVLLLPGPEPVRTAGAPAEVTLDSPPLVALTFDDGPRSSAEGHQIGIHTYDHVELKGLSRQDFDLQVGKTRALITQLVGEGNYWLRPPYGLMDRQAGQWCGGPVILWSVDPEDWKDDNIDRIVAAVVEHVSDGDIILLHDLFPSSAQAALRVVDTLLARGCCFVTVEQLMAERGVTPEVGARYRKIN